MEDKVIGRSVDTSAMRKVTAGAATGSCAGGPDDHDASQLSSYTAESKGGGVWPKLRVFLRPSKTGLLIPAVLGFMVACSSQAAQFGWVPFDHVYLYLQAIGYAVLFALLYMIAFRGVQFARTRVFDGSNVNVAGDEAASTGLSNADDCSDDSVTAMTGKPALAGKITSCEGRLRGNPENPGNADVTSTSSANMSHRCFAAVRRYFHFRYVERPSAIAADASILLCCWLPYIVLLFPGVIHFDTGDQIAEYYGMPLYGMNAGKIWDHHPFLDTYLYGWFAALGKALFDNYNIGMYIYALLQAIGFAFGIAWLLAYLGRTSLNRKLLHGFAAFFCFFPVVPMCVMSIAKDTTSAMFFIPWAVMYCKLVDTSLGLLRNPWFVTAFALDGLLVALTRKLGLYIIVLCLLVLVIGRFAAKFKAAAVAFAVVLFVIVDMAIPKFVFQHINVVPGTPEAALALPIQMMARAAHDHPDDISDADRAAVNDYLEYSWERIGRDYDPWLAVPAIGWTVKGKVPVSRLAKAWLDVGLRHPDSYLQGFFCLEAGWMTFDAFSVKYQPIPKPVSVVMLPMTTSDTAAYTYGVLQPHTPPTEASETVKQLYRTLVDTPGVNIPFFMALWTSVLPGFILYYLWRRRKERRQTILMMNRNRRTDSDARLGQAVQTDRTVGTDGETSRFNAIDTDDLADRPAADLMARASAAGRNLLLKCLPWLLSAASLYVCAESLSRPGRPSPTRFVFQLVLLTPMVIGFLCSSRGSQTSIDEDPAEV
ncbi:DUF6020 family protein [Bifidobacterium sp. ESL0764]|uniref:DUF6020 family protein n=1 Tax=Bifidobacterium sp. ESL0764 TaxID=2983228 RepID=UPI0023F741A5|nr:DUF6020 family protein [Bifidobacterium sp. ESL0764]WEV65403.1 DUF6020 family protein [Bifidobacterium sp. ESL0764]